MLTACAFGCCPSWREWCLCAGIACELWDPCDGSMEMMRAGLVDAACEPLGKLPSLSRPLCRAWVTYGRAPPRKRVGMGGRTGDMRRGAEGKEGGRVWT